MRSTNLTVVVLVCLLLTGVAAAQTVVPGHDKDRYDTDNNGYPDVGVTTTGKYVSLYADDASGGWYWDLGDGRIYGNVSSVDQLDAATRTICDYQNQYRAQFNNDPYMDNGWIINAINCRGYAPGAYLYLIVHESDPRYTGNPDWAIWGTWEYHVLTVSGSGNLVARLAAPASAVGAK